MKKIFSKILIFFVLFTNLFIPLSVNAEVTLSTVNIKTTSLSLVADDLSPNVQYLFSVSKQDNTSPDYYKENTVTSNISGVATSSLFTGLKPGGRYTGMIRSKADLYHAEAQITFVMPVSNTTQNPTIKFQLAEERPLNTDGLTAWDLNINTTNIPDSKSVSIQLFENGTRVQIGESTANRKTEIINKNVGNYFTNYILKQGTKYKVIAYYGNFSGSFEKTTIGKAAEIPVTTNTTDTFWFVNADKNIIGATGINLRLPGFTTFAECEIARKKYWSNFNDTYIEKNEACKIKTEGEVLAEFAVERRINANMPDEVTTFDTKNNPKSLEDYTLLAPIGDFKKAPDNIGDYFNLLFKLAIGLCAVLAVVMIVIGGIQYMGDESIFSKTDAKNKIVSSIFGLLIALGSYAILNTINPDLLGGKGVNIKAVSASTEFTRTSGGGYFGVTIGGGGANANKNVTEYDVYLKKAASRYGLDCSLVKAFMYAESGGVNGLTSPAGAKGLIQLMDGTFKEQNVGTNPMDPETNIMAGASYLSRLKKNGCAGTPKSKVCDISNLQFLAASYNGGPGANTPSKRPECPNNTYWNCPQTICNNGTDCFKETRIYAPRVEANYKKILEQGWGC